MYPRQYCSDVDRACSKVFWLLTTLFPLAAEPKSLSKSPLTYIPYLPKTWRLSALAVQPDTTPAWEAAPALALSVLFISSTLFSEAVTGSKYPAYKGYKRRVGMFSPISTLWKAFYLRATGEKEAIDAAIWQAKSSKHTKAE